MKPIALIALAPLALAACNMTPGGGGVAGTGNNSSVAAAVPDSVVVNGVTYVRAGGTAAAPVGASTPPVAPVAAPTAPPINEDTATSGSNTPPAPDDQPDGVSVTGGH